MRYKEITLSGETAAQIKSELLFEIASERVASTEIICFIIYNKGDQAQYSKLSLAAKKHLKSFKNRGIIQFYATIESFNKNDTEAKFLLNKYPEEFENIQAEDESRFVLYVKL